MPRYVNIVDTDVIKDTYPKINDGFANIESEVDDTNDRITDHTNGTAERHNAGQIDNDSTVTGTTVEDALDTLKGALDTAVLAASIADIGVFSVDATGTDTLTGTNAIPAYFGNLKIHLKIANDNTGSATFNLNTLGAKNIYKIVKGVKTALSPRDLRVGEIAVLEYDGTDFILLNGEREAEYSTEATSTSVITSLPSTVVDGELQAEVSGRVVTNLLGVKGDCEDATDFTGTNATLGTSSTAGNFVFGTKGLSITLTSTSGTADLDIFSSLVAGKYYLASAYIRRGNATNIKFGFETDDEDVETTASTSTTFVRVGVVIAPTDFDTATTAELRLTVTGASANIAYADGLMLSEITATEYALGASVLLDKYNYINNTKPTDKIRILSEGKNLSNNDSSLWEQGTIDINGLNMISLNAIRTIGFIDILPSTSYTYSLSTGYRVLSPCFYDINKNFIKRETPDNASSKTYLTPNNARYIRLVLGKQPSEETSVGIDLPIANPQLELGSTATTYEPYTSTQGKCPIALRDLPNGVADTYNANEGKHIKRVSDEYTIVEADVTSINTSNAYADLALIPETKFIGGVKINTITDNSKFIIGTLIPTSLVPDASNDRIGYFYASAFFSSIVIPVAKGTSLATAKTALAGTKVYYQLANPITTNYYPSILQAKANGRFAQEPYVEEVGIYDSGVDIEDTDYPIANMVYVNEINVQTGALTPIALSAVTVATGGLSFTVSGASNGEYYDYGYNYATELTTQGAIKYTNNINAIAQTDTNTKQIKDLQSQNNQLNSLLQTALDRIAQIEDDLANP